MTHPDYNSPSALKEILDANGFSMQKKFGQNFLVNGDARRRIADALALCPGTRVWEVGPGLGAMTSEILARGADLTAFEIDRGFISLIQRYFSDYAELGRFRIVEGDVLRTWRACCERGGIPDRFFGNLPYNIAAAIIADTIEAGVRFERCVVTVQKEVAQRMTASPGSADYSSFSVLCGWAYDVSPLQDLSGGCFWPRPNVDSRAVVMTRRDGFPGCSNPSLFIKTQRALFMSRRKTVRNNLTAFLHDGDLCLDVLGRAGVDPMCRAEVLGPEEMLRLSDVINDDIIGGRVKL